MRKLKNLIAAAAITAMVLTGCSSSNTGTTDSTGTTNTTEGTDVTVTAEADSVESGGGTILTGISTTSEVEVNTEFTARDLEVGYEESEAVTIALKDNATSISGDSANGTATVDGNVVTVSSEGTYILSGALSDGQIVVDVKDSEKVQLILNGVTINNSTSAAIYIKSADKVFITLEDAAVNTLTDGSEYVQTDDTNVDGVIFSKADLTLNGSGTLNITGSYKHGIVSKDDIVITGGIYNITAVKDAINGEDAVKIKDGTLILSADTGNGIQSKNGDDTTKGYIYIAGGSITVTKSQEGIEGTVVYIEEGTVDITSADDGINATSGSSDESGTTGSGTAQGDNFSGMTPPDSSTAGAPADGSASIVPNGEASTDGTSSATLDEEASADGTASAVPDNTASADSTANAASGTNTFGTGDNTGRGSVKNQGGFGGGMDQTDTNSYILISGGTVAINASGDGIDSNGDLFITGGTVYVSGPSDSGNGALDYNGTANISGGYVIAAGSTGMAQGFSDTSTQYSLLDILTEASTAGTEITLTASDGTVVASFTPAKEYQSVVISAPELTKDATYTLTSGTQSDEITLSSIATSNGQQSMGGQRGSRP